MKIKNSSRSPKGFTLIEMVVVMGIIAVLAGGAIFFMKDIVGSSKIQTTRTSITSIGSALDSYEMLGKKGYPTTRQGLEALRTKPTTSPIPKDHNPMFKESLPVDPWGNAFEYKSDRKSYEIISKGPDGELGTSDDLSSKDQ